MSTDHFIKRCRHGTFVTQCRCAAKDKRTIIVACPARCPTKAAPESEPTATPAPPVTSKETAEYEWPLTFDRLRMWGQDN